MRLRGRQVEKILCLSASTFLVFTVIDYFFFSLKMRFLVLCAFVVIFVGGEKHATAAAGDLDIDGKTSQNEDSIPKNDLADTDGFNTSVTTPSSDASTLKNTFSSTDGLNVSVTTPSSDASTLKNTFSSTDGFNTSVTTPQNDASTLKNTFSSTDGFNTSVTTSQTDASTPKNNFSSTIRPNISVTTPSNDASTLKNTFSGTDGFNMSVTTPQNDASTPKNNFSSTNRPNISVTTPLNDASTLKNSFSNTSTNNIFDTIFDIGSKDDLLTTLDSIQINIKSKLNNFLINLTETEEIVYYNMTTERIDQSSDESQFELKQFSDYTEIRLVTTPNVIKIDGLFRLNIKYVKRPVFGNFTILFENPILVQTRNSTGISYRVEQDNQDIQVSVRSPPKYYLTVARGIHSIVEDIKSALFHDDVQHLAENKIEQFQAAFLFLPDVLSLRLNTNHTFTDLTPINKKQEYFVAKSRPVFIHGLGNLTYVKINVFEVNYQSEELLAYNITVKTGALDGQCEWFYRSNQDVIKRNRCDFGANTSTLSISIQPKTSRVPSNDDYSSGYRGDIILSFDSIESSVTKIACDTSTTQFLQSFLSWDLENKLKRYFAGLLDTKYRSQRNPLDDRYARRR